jgi:hypothetical protein
MGGFGLRLRATHLTSGTGSNGTNVWGDYCANVAGLLTNDEFVKKRKKES